MKADGVYIVDRGGSPAARIIRRSDTDPPFYIDGLEDGLSQDEFWQFGRLLHIAQVDHFEFKTGEAA